ncbi:hypothetical protein D9758_014502 [Tetrapyrgos nigripes]|uniref:DUF6533 domain-containing protein n=1 Tax=Tetrapyrgos nigripes TaxID=182062 RepID=A0A8H5CTW7_9AGAR|nr:hypothetical protein D9758_014502 [Tetrapyrgos nigripes]
MPHMYDSPEALQTAVNEYTEWYATNYVGFAGFTALIWDHLMTFPLEFEFIWKEVWKDGMNPRKMKPLLYLFLINRYLTPLGFIVNLFAYLSQDFETIQSVLLPNSDSPCHLADFKEDVPTLYCGDDDVLADLCSISSAKIRHLCRGCVVGHPDFCERMGIDNRRTDLHACTMIFREDLSNVASSTAWLPLLYDTIVISLTLFKAVPEIRKKDHFYIWRRLFEDGLLYYSAIFSVTAVLTGMIIKAPPGLKNVTAQLELLVTVMMMSRITLNLKRSGRKERVNDPGHISALVYASPTTPDEAWLQNVAHATHKDTLQVHDIEDARFPDPVLDISEIKHSKGAIECEAWNGEGEVGESGPSSLRMPSNYVSPYVDE